MRWRKLYEIHLSDLKWSIRQFKMSERRTGFLGFYFGQMGQVKQTLFMALFMFPHQYGFMNAIILLVGQWVNVCSGWWMGILVFGRTELLLGPNYLFLLNQQLLNFQSCFSFSEVNCWASIASFSKLSFAEISLWTMQSFSCYWFL